MARLNSAPPIVRTAAAFAVVAGVCLAFAPSARAQGAMDGAMDNTMPVAERMTKAMKIAVGAMNRGYGQVCDLKAMPSAGNGYYPCIDIGPYRFVREYAGAGYRIAGYLVAGGEPFRFMESSGAAAVLLVKGPWETDLLPRALKFEDDISGATAERKRMMEPEERRTEAERRLQDFITRERPPASKTDGQPITEAKPNSESGGEKK